MYNENTIPAQIPEFAENAEYLCYHCVPVDKPAVEMSLGQLHENQPTWDIASMAKGLTRLAELSGEGPCLFDVYSEEEVKEDPAKECVKVWYMPGKRQDGSGHMSDDAGIAFEAEDSASDAAGEKGEKPFIISCAGGAYTCVCSIVESIPTAADLNELGYDVFCLTYRVLQPVLMPLPLDDLAAAIRKILKNKEKLGLQTEEYVVNGFSAGANLTCLWGTESKGWAHYGVPKPKALFPIYPVTSFEGMYEEGADVFLKLMFGENYDPENVKTYDVLNAFTGEYPPCYLVHAKDDPVVPYNNSVRLKEKLGAAGTAAALELVEKGSHGFGDGSGTDAAGWPARAAKWLERIG